MSIVFHLNLKRQWFDMIKAGIKKEEYRELSPYWNKRLFSTGIKIKGKLHKLSDIVICFSNGYAKNREQMFFKINGIYQGLGIIEWGAKPKWIYNCIVLGDKVIK